MHAKTPNYHCQPYYHSYHDWLATGCMFPWLAHKKYNVHCLTESQCGFFGCEVLLEKRRSKFTKTFQRVINTHSKPTCIILLVNYPNNNDNDSLTLEMLKRGQNAQSLPKIVIFSFLCKYIVSKLRIFSLNGLYPNIFFGLFRSKNGFFGSQQPKLSSRITS